MPNDPHEDSGSRKGQVQLLRTEERYRLLFEANPNPMFVFDEETLGFLAVNEAAVRQYGWSREEFLALSLLDIRLSEDRTLVRESLEKHPEVREKRIGRFRHCRKDGTVLDMEVTASSILFDGRPGRLCSLNDITGRKRREEELYAANQRMSALLKALPVGVSFSDDVTCQKVTGNPVLLQQFEAASTENVSASAPDAAAVGRRIRYFLEGRELRADELPLQRAVKENRPIPPMELEVLLPSGRRQFMTVSGAPIHNQAGEVTGGVAVTMDITDSKRSAVALRRSREDLIRAQEVGGMGSWRLDIQRNVLVWSEENYRIFGVAPGASLTYEKFLSIVHPEDRAYVDSQWQAGLAGGAYDIEHRIVVDGEVKWVREKAYLEFDPAGSLQGGFGITQDITRRKQIEEEIKASEENYRRILETANEGVVIGTLDGKISFCNQKWADMLGYAREEILGRVGLDFMAKEQRALVLETRQKLQQGERDTREFRFRRKDGSALWTLCSSSPFKDKEGRLTGYLAMHADITARKRAELALAKSEARFRLLSETAGTLLASPSPQQMVEELCTRVMEHLDCQVFFNFLADETRGCLHLNAYAGIPEEEARKITFLDYGVAVCGCAAREGQRIVAENIFETPDPRTELVKGYGVQAYACHPLMVGGQILGTLSFGTKMRPIFSTEDLKLMKTVADQVAAAMEKIRLLETIQTARDELEIRVQERTAELKEANRHLAAQGQILESFFKDTITPLVLMDRDFNFIRVNEAYAQACQRAVEDFPGHNHFEFFPHMENEAIFHRVVETGVPYQALAKPFSFPDHPEWGVTYWDWILTPLADDQGRTSFLVFSLAEVTDRHVAEEALRQSERQLRSLADQLLYAQENERKRIARDMHDSLGASLSALKYKMEDLVHNLSSRESSQIAETLDSLIPIIQDTIGEARRMQNDLRPPLLDDLGILPTLRWFSREFEKIYAPITITQVMEVEEAEVPDLLKVAIFRITQEALTNAGKHARSSRVHLYLGRERDRLKLEIRDNGAGFNYGKVQQENGFSPGMGLSSMKERAELSGGSFRLDTRPGQGTEITVLWTLNQ